MFAEIITGKLRTLDGRIFTDHNRIALVNKSRLDGRKNGIRVSRTRILIFVQHISRIASRDHLLTVCIVSDIRRGIVFFAPVIEAVAPAFIGSHQRELIRIEVEFRHQIARARQIIARHVTSKKGKHQSFIGTRSLHDNRTGKVVSARCTDRVNHRFMIALQQSHTFCSELDLSRRKPSVIHARFVCTAEKHMLVKILELVCNLRPELALELVHQSSVRRCGSRITRRMGTRKNIVFEPTGIPVAIEEGIHAVVDNHLHDGVNRVEPTFVNGTRRQIGMGIPSRRNTNRLEASLCNLLDILFSRERVSPASHICARACNRHFHRVTDVNTKAHTLLDGSRIRKSRKSPRLSGKSGCSHQRN